MICRESAFRSTTAPLERVTMQSAVDTHHVNAPHPLAALVACPGSGCGSVVMVIFGDFPQAVALGVWEGVLDCKQGFVRAKALV
jgi:hypothetical protein